MESQETKIIIPVKNISLAKLYSAALLEYYFAQIDLKLIQSKFKTSTLRVLRHSFNGFVTFCFDYRIIQKSETWSARALPRRNKNRLSVNPKCYAKFAGIFRLEGTTEFIRVMAVAVSSCVACEETWSTPVRATEIVLLTRNDEISVKLAGFRNASMSR